MKVMIIAQRCAAQDPPNDPTPEVRLEKLLTGVLLGKTQGAVVYHAQDSQEKAVCRDGLAYYPVKCRMDLGLMTEEWEESRRELLRVIEDFSPDIIHCMGSEWPYGLIAESVSIPVVIHLMGFLNVYYTSLDMVLGYSAAEAAGQADQQPDRSLKRKLARMIGWEKPKPSRPAERIMDIVSRRERRIMAAVHYYMGRTEWDRNLAKYYSPGSKYYHVEELLKPLVYEAAGQWEYHWRAGKPLRLVTISSGDDRKGNEIILRTALLLKELLKQDFEWRVAGSRDYFDRYEKITGIHCADVNVKLIGYIRGDQVIEELKAADFFIHPSIIDNSPHAVCEAQMIGCPVIASNVGGIPDLVQDRVTGFLYPYNEPHTLAFLIGNLIQEKDILQNVSANAVRTARRRHDPDRIAESLYQTYEDIIREHEKKTSEEPALRDGGKGTEGAWTP